MEFRSVHNIATAENVRIQVELAGLASRLSAFAIDMMMMTLVMGATLGILYLIAFSQKQPLLAQTGIPLALFILFFGFQMFQEWLWNGKTLGKAMLHIRVVRQNGQPIGFWEAFGRNLLRVLDVYALGIGFLCMLCTANEKRFGDLLVGTLVINDLPQPKPSQLLPPSAAPLEEDSSKVLGTESMAPPNLSISLEEQAWLQAYYTRRRHLFKNAQQHLQTAFCQYLSQRLHQPIATEAELEALLPPNEN